MKKHCQITEEPCEECYTPDSPICVKCKSNEQKMYLNMQYYMEYCEANGYVTPQDWLTNHKHF